MSEGKTNKEALLELREMIAKQLSSDEWQKANCPFGLYGEWYDGVDFAKDAVLQIIDRYIS